MKHVLGHPVNFFWAYKGIIESTCWCGSCNGGKEWSEEKTVQVGDTVECSRKGMLIVTHDGAMIRVKEFEIMRMPKIEPEVNSS